MIKRLCIIGVGLIGGSLARALRDNGACEHVVGCSRNETNLQRAQELGVIDEYTTDVAEAVRGADMIVLSVPLRAMQSLFEKIDNVIDENAVITDVGSSKSSVELAARKGLKLSLSQFIPGHPISGTEKSGVDASFSGLFKGRKIILTPLEENKERDIKRVTCMWESAGANVQNMTVSHHDEVLAATSHLPHVLAFGLVDTLSKMSDSDEIFQYAAGGFRDFTRIASSDPVMWRDICVENSEAIIKIMDLYIKDLESLKQLIASSDLDNIEALFSRAKEVRDRYTRLSKTPSK
ncbi:MAG: prephenate dehydrogenase/arogenate dehydrogenase family protein [Gammaproteobacteria bacterium]|nr:prephenate dehydrogenase/arogenate dehydrogenase family protein [Gammaproteobacteria bacterium]